MSAIVEQGLSVEQVFIEALSLPAQARAKLVDRLIGSLSGDEEIENEWIQEVQDRCKAVDEGKLKTIPAEEVMREAYQLFEKAK
jgi:putative addiction module component (TIGR02574 family)